MAKTIALDSTPDIDDFFKEYEDVLAEDSKQEIITTKEAPVKTDDKKIKPKPIVNGNTWDIFKTLSEEKPSKKKVKSVRYSIDSSIIDTLRSLKFNDMPTGTMINLILKSFILAHAKELKNYKSKTLI